MIAWILTIFLIWGIKSLDLLGLTWESGIILLGKGLIELGLSLLRRKNFLKLIFIIFLELLLIITLLFSSWTLLVYPLGINCFTLRNFGWTTNLLASWFIPIRLLMIISFPLALRTLRSLWRTGARSPLIISIKRRENSLLALQGFNELFNVNIAPFLFTSKKSLSRIMRKFLTRNKLYGSWNLVLFSYNMVIKTQSFFMSLLLEGDPSPRSWVSRTKKIIGAVNPLLLALSFSLILRIYTLLHYCIPFMILFHVFLKALLLRRINGLPFVLLPSILRSKVLSKPWNLGKLQVLMGSMLPFSKNYRSLLEIKLTKKFNLFL